MRLMIWAEKSIFGDGASYAVEKVFDESESDEEALAGSWRRKEGYVFVDFVDIVFKEPENIEKSLALAEIEALKEKKRKISADFEFEKTKIDARISELSAIENKFEE